MRDNDTRDNIVTLIKMKTSIFTTYERLLFPSFGLSAMSDHIVSNVGVALSKQAS